VRLVARRFMCDRCGVVDLGPAPFFVAQRIGYSYCSSGLLSQRVQQ
jgi:hypothetical protein